MLCIPLCWSLFLLVSFVFKPSRLPLTFRHCPSADDKFFWILDVWTPLHIWKVFSLGTECWLRAFSFRKTLLFSHHFQWEICCHTCLYYSIYKCLLFLWLLIILYFLFIGFDQLGYDVPWCSFHHISLVLGVHWASSICKLIIFIEFGKFGAIVLDMPFLFPFLPPFSGFPISLM